MPPSQQQDKTKVQQNYPLRVTLLTLVAYVFGLMFIINYWISIILLIILGLSLLLVLRLQFFYQSFTTLLSFILTCYAFGLVHSYSYQRLLYFINQDIPYQQRQWPLFQIYLSVMCVYYYFQFQLNNLYHPHQDLNWYSFLIYHSKPYMIATLFSLTQHFVTKYFFAFQFKNYHFLVVPSLMLMVIGQVLRVSAFFTAKSNFTHLVRYRKHPKHQLVTHGIYAYLRHPSYTGYFYFSVASQLLLGNWISALGFAIVLIKFFNDRIHDEEFMLASFFQKYLFYKKNTHIFIPFVKSPSNEEIMKYLIRKAGRRNDSDDNQSD